MKRVLFFALLLTVLLGAMIAPAVAAPVSELAGLASYFPAGIPVYASSRTDAAFIDELDALFGQIASAVPDMPPVSLSAQLDQSIQQQYGPDASYETTFAWMGGTAAIGVLSLDVSFDDDFSNDDEVPFLAAVSVSDRAGAEAFVGDLLSDMGSNYEESEAFGYTVFAATEGQTGAIAIGDDVLLIARTPEDMSLDGDFAALNDSETFTGITGDLPAEDYNILLYLDLGDTLSQAMELSMQMMPESQMETMGMLMPLYANYPTQAIGFTVLDGRSLTIDFAQGAIDLAFYEQFGVENVEELLQTVPVDLALASAIPADAPFVIMQSQLGKSIDFGIEAMGVALEMSSQQIASQMNNDFGSSREIPEINANAIRAFIDLAFAGMTGLNLQNDVLPNMNGTSAIFGRIQTAENTLFTYDTALVVEVTSEEAANNIFNSFVNALDQYEVAYGREDNAVTLENALAPVITDTDLGSQIAAELDFLFGFNSDVFALGTAAGAGFAVAPEGDSLADDAAFVDAQQFFLPESSAVAYLSFAPLVNLLDEVDAMGFIPEESRTDFESGRAVLNLFSSGSITANIDEDASTVTRIVLTLK